MRFIGLDNRDFMFCLKTGQKGELRLSCMYEGSDKINDKPYQYEAHILNMDVVLDYDKLINIKTPHEWFDHLNAMNPELKDL